MSRVFVRTTSIGDNIQVTLICVGHNQIVHDSSFSVCEEGKSALEKEMLFLMTKACFFFFTKVDSY